MTNNHCCVSLRRLLTPLLVVLLSVVGSYAISIDNDIIGEPDIECLDQEIRVWVKTRKYFQGRIYAKGKADDPECAKDDFSARRIKKVHFDLGLGRCGMKSLRSFDPRGMYYGVTLVISFHPMFITKVDQAFHVKCFFEEANRGLTAELGVSMIPTTEVEARHGIPGCSYSIHRSSIDELDAGKPAGTAIQFAKVGDKVLHQWHCDDQMYGILINNCFVTDGVKQRHQVIDSRGCPIDALAITGIRYSADLQRAYAESQVFKFADRPGVWFFCQIQMCMKKDGMCDGVTPPSCATTSPPLRGGGKKAGGGKQQQKGSDVVAPTTEEEERGEEGAAAENSSNEQDPGAVREHHPERIAEYDDNKGAVTPVSRDEEEAEAGATTGDNNSGPNDYDTQAPKPEYTTTVKSSTLRARSRQDESPGHDAYGAGPPGISPEDGAPAEGSTTYFGPGYAANQVGEGPYGVGRDPPGVPPTVNPYIPASPPPRRRQQQEAAVSAEFETEDDLRGRGAAPGTALVRPTATTAAAPLAAQQSSTPREQRTTSGGQKKDYVDYEAEVPIPPNLTDLLANLQPEDINAQSLQRMFRDSVSDRRALLQGFDFLIRKMRQEEEADEDEEGRRGPRRRPRNRKEQQRHDSPEGEDKERKNGQPEHRAFKWNSGQRTARDLPDGPPKRVEVRAPVVPSGSGKQTEPAHALAAHQWRESANDPPMIAGQLLIYDLDELPPSLKQSNPNQLLQSSLAPLEECAITRHGLALLAVASAGVAFLLLCMAVGVFFRLRTQIGQKMARTSQGEEGQRGVRAGRDRGGEKQADFVSVLGTELSRRRTANSRSNQRTDGGGDRTNASSTNEPQ